MNTDSDKKYLSRTARPTTRQFAGSLPLFHAANNGSDFFVRLLPANAIIIAECQPSVSTRLWWLTPRCQCNYLTFISSAPLDKSSD